MVAKDDDTLDCVKVAKDDDIYICICVHIFSYILHTYAHKKWIYVFFVYKRIYIIIIITHAGYILFIYDVFMTQKRNPL